LIQLGGWLDREAGGQLLEGGVGQIDSMTLSRGAHGDVLGADQTAVLIQGAEQAELVPGDAEDSDFGLNVFNVEGFLAELTIAAQLAQEYVIGRPAVCA